MYIVIQLNGVQRIAHVYVCFFLLLNIFAALFFFSSLHYRRSVCAALIAGFGKLCTVYWAQTIAHHWKGQSVHKFIDLGRRTVVYVVCMVLTMHSRASMCVCVLRWRHAAWFTFARCLSPVKSIRIQSNMSMQQVTKASSTSEFYSSRLGKVLWMQIHWCKTQIVLLTQIPL